MFIIDKVYFLLWKLFQRTVICSASTVDDHSMCAWLQRLWTLAFFYGWRYIGWSWSLIVALRFIVCNTNCTNSTGWLHLRLDGLRGQFNLDVNVSNVSMCNVTWLILVFHNDALTRTPCQLAWFFFFSKIMSHQKRSLTRCMICGGLDCRKESVNKGQWDYLSHHMCTATL